MFQQITRTLAVKPANLSLRNNLQNSISEREDGGRCSAAGLDRGAAAQPAAAQEGHYQVSAGSRSDSLSCRT